MTPIPTNLFEFAFIPSWFEQLDTLAEMAIAEPWRFPIPQHVTKNEQTPILERYLQTVFQYTALDYIYAEDASAADQAFYIRNQIACFHTGLFSPRYTGIYAYFERNKRKESLVNWFFKGFVEEHSPWLKYVDTLPLRPFRQVRRPDTVFYPGWSIRVNVPHILNEPENQERLPESIRGLRNLPLLLETAVELARRQVEYSPGVAVPQIYGNALQFLLPICLTDMETPDLAMTLTPMAGFYVGSTCLTLEMAYHNARLIEKPVAPWLTSIVTPNR